MTIKRKKPTYAQLERENAELLAGRLVRSGHALQNIKRASGGHMTGSAVMLQLTGIGGKEIIPPVMIRDGLSEATIEALCDDIKRSRELTLSGV